MKKKLFSQVEFFSKGYVIGIVGRHTFSLLSLFLYQAEKAKISKRSVYLR